MAKRERYVMLEVAQGVWGYFGFVPNKQGPPQNISEAICICKLCFRTIGRLLKPRWQYTKPNFPSPRTPCCCPR